MHYLQSLNLAYNVFGSPIPYEIKKLKNLKHLNLSNVGFYGQIPKEISYLKKLDVVDLQTDNDYDGSIEKGFEACTNWNALDGGGFMSLLNSFEHR
ncbi:hypothetical protein AHAS_Ahas15G0248000 [Arachis hypogaea]